MWFVFTQLFLVGTAAYVLAAEAWAVLVETAFFMVVIASSERDALRRHHCWQTVVLLAGLLVGSHLWELPVERP